MRWPNGVACPRAGCGNANLRKIERKVWIRPPHKQGDPKRGPHGDKPPKVQVTRHLWYCKECKRQFTLTVGTIFEDSPIGLEKWLPAAWLLSADRNGISSCELARALRVRQSTAWHMLHRIRLAMSDDETPEPFGGEVEADETYIGGKLKFSKEARRRKRKGMKWDPDFNKTAVLGIVQRGGKARAWSVPDGSYKTLLPRFVDSIRPDATLYTDGAWSFWYIGKKFAKHEWTNHAIRYVEGNIHTQNIEGFWSVLRRTIGGTYIHIEPRHLDRYLAEQCFRFNERKNADGPRFKAALKGADNRRLTYKVLTAKPNEE